MALQVWLPLINDIKNKGVADIEVTNNGATLIANGGKIGGCYSFDGSNNYLLCTPVALSNDDTNWSFACWFYPNKSHNGCLLCNRTKVGTSGKINGIAIFYFSGHMYVDDGVRWDVVPSKPIAINTWNHIVITREVGVGKRLYLNGELINSTTVVGATANCATEYFSIGGSQQDSETDIDNNFLNGRINDVRIYNHVLSPKEVKEISKALAIHLKMDELSQDPISQIIYDSSGYGNNGTSSYAQQTFSTNTPRNSSCNLRTSSKSYVYCRINGNADYNNGNGWMVQGAEAMTVSEWAYATDWTKQTNCRLWSCTESGGWNTEGGSTGYLRIPINVYTNSGKTSYTYKYTSQEIELASLTPGWHMFTFTYEQSYGTKVYVDGELHSQNPYTSYGLHYNLTGSSLNLGAESTGIASAASPWFVGGLSDFRLYYTALSAEDIKELYEVSMSISSYGDVLPYELLEDDEVSGLTKAGVLQSSAYLGNGDWMPYDQTIYTEPDGSQWVKIVHHNNPASKLFGSGNTFATTVYIDEDRWFNASLCDSVNQWEFMVKEAVAANGTELKYRWIQDANPMTAVYADVGSAKITKYTSEDGYNNFTSNWGGIYKKNSYTFLSQNNGTSSSWWGAIGSWTAYQGGIPGFGNNTISTHIIKTGYLDLYLRIDNLTFCETDSVARTYKNTAWSARQFIER